MTTQLRLHLAIAERDRYVLELDRGRVRRKRRAPRVVAQVHRRVQARADQALSGEGGDRRLAQRERDRSFAVRRTQRHAASRRNRRARIAMANCSPSCAAALRSSAARPYRVTLLGRWSQLDAPSPGRSEGSSASGKRADTPRGAGVRDRHRGCRRRAKRRAGIGRSRAVATPSARAKAAISWSTASTPAADIARSWFDKGAWWVADTGSTNGIRVESPNGTIAAFASGAAGRDTAAADRARSGAWLVLSAQIQGDARQYPRLSLRPATAVAARRASASAAAPPTPGDADRAAATPRRRVDHHRPHGFGLAKRRRSPRPRFHFVSGARATRRW